MKTRKVRLAVVMVGDIKRKSDMRIKYGYFLDALSQRFDVVDIFDASLYGLSRYWNALMTFNPSVPVWKEYFFKNVWAFKMRSYKAYNHLRGLKTKPDVVLQIGALLNPVIHGGVRPIVVYTDNTTRITSQDLDGGRLALSPRELEDWVAYEGRLYYSVNHITVRSSLVRRSLIDDYDVKSDKVSVVGGGVNFSSMPHFVKRLANSAPVRILFIGEGFYRKGGDILLHAFAKARAVFPETKLYMVTRAAIPSGFPMENVQVFPTTWDRSVISKYYQEADLFVLPSRQETWGDVLLESMAYGLPCIGVRGQAMEDIIVHETTGLLVDNGHIDGLANALIRLIGDVTLRSDLGKNARSLVKKRFTWEVVVDKLSPILEVAACRQPHGK